jgi:hypothetical protein
MINRRLRSWFLKSLQPQPKWIQLCGAVVLGLLFGVSLAFGMNQESAGFRLWIGTMASGLAAILLYGFMRLFSHRIEVLRSRETKLQG